MTSGQTKLFQKKGEVTLIQTGIHFMEVGKYQRDTKLPGEEESETCPFVRRTNGSDRKVDARTMVSEKNDLGRGK